MAVSIERDTYAPADEAELLQWLPEIDYIEGDLGEETTRLFLEDVPDYFWYVRASKNYHPVDHRGVHGLVIHTKRAYVQYESFADAFEKQGILDSYERNCGRASILLHDSFKYGHPPIDEDSGTEFDHDQIAATYFQENSDLPFEVIRNIDTHNGGWSEGDVPRTDPEQLHHLADYSASRSHNMIGLLDPHPVLIEKYPHLKDMTISPDEL